MVLPKILLLVGGNPIRNGAGINFLNDLCSKYPQNKLSPYFFSDYYFLPEFQKTWLGIKIKNSHHPFEGLKFKSFPDFYLLNYYIHTYVRKIQIPVLTKKVINYANNEQSELIWAILNSASMIYLVKKIIDDTNLPVVCTVWDAPEKFSVDLGMDPRSTEKLLSDFEYILKKSKNVGVVSESMQIEYKKRYGINSIRQFQGFDESLWCQPSFKIDRVDELKIGFAGSLYANEVHEAFLSALNSVNWMIDGRHVSLWIIGREKPNNADDNTSIVYFGWQSIENTISLLSKTDIGYVPYWFDKKYELVIRLGLPNKMVAYLTAGKPIFYHGPDYSAPTIFMERYPLGVCCHSLEKEQIINCLRRVITDPQLYESTVISGQKALRDEFNQKTFLKNFAELIGIEDSDLLNLEK